MSCDSSRVYEDYNDMETSFWHLDSMQRFDFIIEDTTQTYNLYATFRNASSYPYYNIYFNYSLVDSNQLVLTDELREYHLFDPKTGEPFGSGLGDLFDHRVVLEEAITFEHTGSYVIQLQQQMRMDTLPFILSVGARVEINE